VAQTSTVTPGPQMSTPLLFSTIEVTKQAFYRTALSYAIVNLKPIVPGRGSSPWYDVLISSLRARFLDVLVIPNRPVPRLTDLTTPELTSLIASVQNVGRVVERAYGGDALTVACQV
jgi:bis(5'-adenosyl)-triphosphatase